MVNEVDNWFRLCHVDENSCVFTFYMIHKGHALLTSYMIKEVSDLLPVFSSTEHGVLSELL